jgi:hypothetical protein
VPLDVSFARLLALTIREALNAALRANQHLNEIDRPALRLLCN